VRVDGVRLLDVHEYRSLYGIVKLPITY